MSPRSSPRMDTLYDLGKSLGAGFSMGILSGGAEVLGGVKPGFLWMSSQRFQEPAHPAVCFPPYFVEVEKGHPGSKGLAGVFF